MAMFSFFRWGRNDKDEFRSSLFDEGKFYRAFVNDLLQAKREVIIESPFITRKRMDVMFPALETLVGRGVRVVVVTRHPSLHSEEWGWEAEQEIMALEKLGVEVVLTTNYHHRKLGIIDRDILWEGSLNILSHVKSREIMRRIESEYYAKEMFEFLKLGKLI